MTYKDKDWQKPFVISNKSGLQEIRSTIDRNSDASYYDIQVYGEHSAIEEDSVEFLKQKICEEKQIVSNFAYKGLTDFLQVLNNTFNYGSDMEFAKELFNIPIPDRYQWLEEKVDNSLRDMSASFEDYNEVMSFIEALKGRY